MIIILRMVATKMQVSIEHKIESVRHLGFLGVVAHCAVQPPTPPPCHRALLSKQCRSIEAQGRAAPPCLFGQRVSSGARVAAVVGHPLVDILHGERRCP